MSIESCRNRLRAASPEPWEIQGFDLDEFYDDYVTVGRENDVAGSPTPQHDLANANADLIASAPTDLRLALDVIEYGDELYGIIHGDYQPERASEILSVLRRYKDARDAFEAAP